jgi:hypothetical protein
MKRNFIIALVAFAAVTAAVGTAVASLLPSSDVVLTSVDVNKAPTGTSDIWVNAGQYDITAGSNEVIINVVDSRTPPPTQDTRKGYNTAHTLILTTTSSTAYSSGVSF